MTEPTDVAHNTERHGDKRHAAPQTRCENWRLPRKKPRRLTWACSVNPRVGGFRFGENKLRGQDSNLRPRGYEPRELPGCSTPRPVLVASRQCNGFPPRAKWGEAFLAADFLHRRGVGGSDSFINSIFALHSDASCRAIGKSDADRPGGRVSLQAGKRLRPGFLLSFRPSGSFAGPMAASSRALVAAIERCCCLAPRMRGLRLARWESLTVAGLPDRFVSPKATRHFARSDAALSEPHHSEGAPHER